MTRGALLTISLATLGLGGMVYAFLNSASPYVTIAEAKQAGKQNVHLPGEILKPTLQTDITARQVRFRMKDEKGDEVQVVYNGPAPSNLGTATKVVAIGSMSGDVFECDKMLIKCPSKYEGEQKS